MLVVQTGGALGDGKTSGSEYNVQRGQRDRATTQGGYAYVGGCCASGGFVLRARVERLIRLVV